MIKLFALMKYVDLFLFQKVDQLLNNLYYQRVIEKISSLTPRNQQIANHVITIGTIFIPIIITFFFLLNTCSISSDLAVKQEVMDYIKKISNQNNTLSSTSKKFISNSIISTKNDLNSQIDRICNRNKINTSKINILNFNKDNKSKSFSSINSEISFKDFTTNELANFMSSAMQNKFQIKKLSVYANKTKETIKGELTLSYYGKKIERN